MSLPLVPKLWLPMIKDTSRPWRSHPLSVTGSGLACLQVDWGGVESGVAPGIPCARGTLSSRCAIQFSTIRRESDFVVEFSRQHARGVINLPSGVYGLRTAEPGVVADILTDVALVTLTARTAGAEATRRAIAEAFGIELPTGPKRAVGRDISFVWSGPQQWLAVAYPAPLEGIEAMLRPVLAGSASVVEQSHGRTIFRLRGSRVRETMVKGFAIDLDPRAFKTNDTALTAVAHMNVHIWQSDDRPTFEVAVPRSFTLSFWHWLEASAAQFGIELNNRDGAL
jgi:methylglutamate dehydrogenase subunit D